MTTLAPPPAVDAAIVPGETVRWWGAPPTGLMLRASDALDIPFSMLWGGFAIFWETMVVRSGNAPWFFELWGVPFVLIGLYLIIGRFLVDALLRAQTSYVVTDRAAYIIRGAPFSLVRRFAGSALQAVSFEPSSSGRGTLRFGPRPSSMFTSRNPWSMPPADALERIDDAPHVYQLVAEAGRAP